MKTKVSPMWLTYFMLKWDEVRQRESSQKCTLSGRPQMQTELITDEGGANYEGFVCHADRQVTWVRVS